MGEDSLEAEQRGFNFLHMLAHSHRNDALEVSQKNKPPEDTGFKIKVKLKGVSHLENGSSKTRKKEKLTAVFALSDTEFK